MTSQPRLDWQLNMAQRRILAGKSVIKQATSVGKMSRESKSQPHRSDKKKKIKGTQLEKE